MYQECRHIMPSGARCHSPALQSEVYCYFHTNLRRYTRSTAGNNLPLHSIEDHRGIQIALTQILTSLNSPYVDTRRAGLMLYGIQLASQLASRIADSEPNEVVRTCDESNGTALAPEKTVCEPPIDCPACPTRRTCEASEYDEDSKAEPAADDSELEDEDCGDKHDCALTRAIIGAAKNHAPLSSQPRTSEERQEVSGHDFGRAEKPRKRRWASAPEYPHFPQAANTAIARGRCLPNRIEGPP